MGVRKYYFLIHKNGKCHIQKFPKRIKKYSVGKNKFKKIEKNY